ncbi:MAG TPA: aminotransferase class V-fold PLP-dependent enzyme [Chitinophagaceae bacterium]|nr:aminotransferase class V-fold PLP-dependent enzyme [Chitinophagaceae bacterium]
MPLAAPIYLDNNATTPLDPRVLEAMMPYFKEDFGNAGSRDHSYGWKAAEGVDIARERVSALIHAQPKEIVFTSGATEAVNLAIKGVFDRYSAKGSHMITCSTEHQAVLDTCKTVSRLGGKVTILPVHANGLIDLTQLEKEITKQTILVSIMLANNETGIIQPIEEISLLTRKNGTLLFSDGTQAVGKIPLDMDALGIDLMAFSGHKIYGPKGIGALYVRHKNPRVTLTAQQDGGGQENNMRSGTQNVPGIVGLGKACQLCEQELPSESPRLRVLRDRLEQALVESDLASINGNIPCRLGHVSNLLFAAAEGDELMKQLYQAIAVSRSSACTSVLREPSHVLKAMGLTDREANNSFRFSLGRFTTAEQMDFVIPYLIRVAGRTRN